MRSFILCASFCFISLFVHSTLHIPAKGSSMENKETIKIEGVYFFGYEGLDIEKIEKELSFKAGISTDVDDWFTNKMPALKSEIEKLTGAEATDAALVHTKEGTIVFVGLPGKSNSKPESYNKPGSKRINAPELVSKTYTEMTELLPAAVSRKKQSDVDAYAAKRKELEAAGLAERAALLQAVESNNNMDRIAASYTLGLIADKQEELEALVKLADDPDSAVRNNSTREIGELLYKKPELAKYVPSRRYIEMVNSPTWTDRNKAMFVLQGLTKTRDQKTLEELRQKALPSLIEMCKWPSGYSESAIELLGRIAGIPQEKLEGMSQNNDATQVLKELEKQQSTKKEAH